MPATRRDLAEAAAVYAQLAAPAGLHTTRQEGAA